MQQTQGRRKPPSEKKKINHRLAKCLTCASTLTKLQDGFDGFYTLRFYQVMPVACIEAVHATWVECKGKNIILGVFFLLFFRETKTKERTLREVKHE